MAGVIRKEQFESVRAFSFADLEAQGRQILDRAEARARQMLQQAQQEAEQLKQQARQAGHQTGLAEGRAAGLKQIRAETHQQAVEDARDEVNALVQALTVSLAEFEQSKRGLLAAAESGLIELALSIARRVCKLEAGSVHHDSHRQRPQPARTRPARRGCRAPLETRLSANCSVKWAPNCWPRTDRFAHVHLLADERISAGGCLLRSRT